MKNGKKIITGVALLASLSIFAGTTIASNTVKTTSTTTGTGTANTRRERPTEQEREAFKQKMDTLRQKLENGTATKAEMAEAAKFLAGKGERKGDGQRPEGMNDENRISPERIEQLKTKIKSGRLTATEAEEVLKLIERKGPGRGRGDKPNNTINNNTNTK